MFLKIDVPKKKPTQILGYLVDNQNIRIQSICRFIQKLRTIFKLTKTHAINLAKFVFGYKLVKGILEKSAGQAKVLHYLYSKPTCTISPYLYSISPLYSTTLFLQHLSLSRIQYCIISPLSQQWHAAAAAAAVGYWVFGENNSVNMQVDHSCIEPIK